MRILYRAPHPPDRAGHDRPSGADRIHTADWREGELRYGGLLTPQGKVIADYLASRTADGVLLTHETLAEDLMKR
ncbi:MAG: hypothetical protein R3C04_03130 [Hyphomonas sp.]